MFFGSSSVGMTSSCDFGHANRLFAMRTFALWSGTSQPEPLGLAKASCKIRRTAVGACEKYVLLATVQSWQPTIRNANMFAPLMTFDQTTRSLASKSTFG